MIYDVKGQAVFDFSFEIEANSPEEAQRIFDEHCFVGMLKEPTTTNDAVVNDWNVPMHHSDIINLTATLK